MSPLLADFIHSGIRQQDSLQTKKIIHYFQSVFNLFLKQKYTFFKSKIDLF